jgi:hypothetical protein
MLARRGMACIALMSALLGAFKFGTVELMQAQSQPNAMTIYLIPIVNLMVSLPFGTDELGQYGSNNISETSNTYNALSRQLRNLIVSGRRRDIRG